LVIITTKKNQSNPELQVKTIEAIRHPVPVKQIEEIQPPTRRSSSQSPDTPQLLTSWLGLWGTWSCLSFWVKELAPWLHNAKGHFGLLFFISKKWSECNKQDLQTLQIKKSGLVLQS
jgi:hypothetical protein